jgi:hypothetical protein
MTFRAIAQAEEQGQAPNGGLPGDGLESEPLAIPLTVRQLLMFGI